LSRRWSAGYFEFTERDAETPSRNFVVNVAQRQRDAVDVASRHRAGTIGNGKADLMIVPEMNFEVYCQKWNSTHKFKTFDHPDL